jgi:flagella basal body P-ring formation protein FlgA
MRLSRLRFIVATLAALAATSTARAEPVTVELNERATVGKSVVTVGDVALVSGGDVATRTRVSQIDVAEFKSRDPSVVVGRRSVEYRLLLAGLEPAAVRVAGAERVTVTAVRRTVTVEEITAAARTELLRQFGNPADPVTVELALPIVVKLPEVPADERVVITAKPRSRPTSSGRVQVDVTLAMTGETLLSFPLHMEVRSQSSLSVPVAPVAQAGGVVPRTTVTPVGGTQFASTEILVRPRQRVEMQVNSGGLKVTATGEAQQAGKLGQSILVQNIDSKKTVSARVTGPGTVEVDLGGAP